MSSLQTTTKEELAQELLAFKHLAILPELVDDITFKIQLLSMKTEFHDRLYDNYRLRKRINHDKNIKNLQFLLDQLDLPKPIDTEKWKHKIFETRDIRKDKLRADIEKFDKIIALDKAEEEKIASKICDIEQDINACIAFELDAFKKIKEKEGKVFKFFDVTEEELRKIAEKRFEKALEIVRYFQQQFGAAKI